MAGVDELQFTPIDYGDPVGEEFFDASQMVLGTLGRLDLTVVNANTIRAAGGVGADVAGMGIGGALRWNAAPVDRAMPGAPGAGRFDVYVTTGPTVIVAGNPPDDQTDYSWDLAIVPQGDPAPATAYSKRVGYLDWSGAAITRLVQTFGRQDDRPQAAVSNSGGISALEAIMPGGAAAPAIRAQVGLVEVFRVESDGDVWATGRFKGVGADLSAAGKQALVLSAADGGLTIGGDVTLFRHLADVLRTNDNFWADFNISAQIGGAGQTSMGAMGPGGQAGVLMNDVAWWRGAVGRIDTAAGVRIGGNLTFSTDGGAVVFGIAGDVSLFRDEAGVIRTGGDFRATGSVSARRGNAAQVLMGGFGPGGLAGFQLGDTQDVNLYRAAADLLATDDAMRVGGTLTALAALAHTGATLGVYGVAPAARPAARALTNWAVGANARRAIDRNNWTPGELFDFVMTMAYDLQQPGLFA